MHFKKENIPLVETPKPATKSPNRIFYKTYYVYGGQYSQMTDLIRASFVFNNFEDLYHGFQVFDKCVKANKTIENGILRVKDRFNVERIDFGYRDLLINLFAPESKLVCEIQFHLKLFYECKGDSHKLYKIARIFEYDDVNLAYKIADKYFRSSVGKEEFILTKSDEHETRSPINEVYVQGANNSQPEFKFNDEDEDEKEEKTYENLLNEWQLSEHIVSFKNNGFEDVGMWDDLVQEDCKILKDDIKMTNKGHLKKKFEKKKYKEYKEDKEKK